jgi:Putative auto-transporter adhesin, head GIN domain
VRDDPECSVTWCTVQVARAAVMLAITALLAGCVGTSAGSSPGSAGTGTPGTSRTPNGSDGGVGGNGGDGYGGWGGNGYGGNGGNANGGAGAGGTAGALSGDFADPAALAGSGRLTSRTVGLSGVTSVVAAANFVVHLRTGGPAQAVVKMDDNLVDRVDATVTGGVLRLGIRPGKSVRNATLAADVTVDQLDRVVTGGASRVTLTDTVRSPTLQLVVNGVSSVTGPIQVDHLQADISGAGNLGLSGQVQDFRLAAAGTSQLPLGGLTARRLDAVLSGTSHAVVTVTDTLAAQATGASVLRYRGTPRVTHSQTSGVSSVVSDTG